MNKTYKYTLTAHEKKEISFDTGVARLAITNGDGVDGSTTVVMSEITKQRSGEIVSFLDGADAPFAELTVDIEAVQSGSGDPSPDNVRPITGWTGAKVMRTRKNLADLPDVTIAYTSYVYTNSLVDLKPGTYTFSAKYSGDNIGRQSSFRLDDKDGNQIFTSNITIANGVNTKTFTITDTAKTVKWYSEATGSYTDGMIELGSQATAYEPYNSETINIDWEDEAGTVYGGTLDVKTGVLTVTHANIASYDGETINEPWISSMDVYSAGATPTTGAQVVYPLTTPVTYQLTPVQVRSLLGINNVWADCGPVNVRYFVQSTQPMIDYIDDKTTAYFDAVEDLSTYDVSLVGATSTDIKNYLLANKNANIVIRVKRYSTILLYYLREYSPNYFAEFATHALIFDAEGTKSMRIGHLRLDLTQETTDFVDDYIILPTT